MHNTTHLNHGNYRTVKDWHADVKFLTRPQILSTRMIGGVKHYTGPGKKLYVAELFDKMFKVVKTQVKPMYTK